MRDITVDEIFLHTGEWWKADLQSVESEVIAYGGGPNVSDAHTINGFPGPLYPCSAQRKNSFTSFVIQRRVVLVKGLGQYSTMHPTSPHSFVCQNADTFVQQIEHGKTYMLRIVNAILMAEIFFGIANHTLTVVEIDGTYVKPFKTPAIMIAPGQTTAVLLTADKGRQGSNSTFSMAARPYVTDNFPFDGTTTLGFFQYQPPSTTTTPDALPLLSAHPSNLHYLPPMEDTAFNTEFSAKLRSLASAEYPCNVPKEVDKQLFLTISLNLQDCPPNKTCRGYLGKRFSASMNNQSFVRQPVSVLESHYRNPSTRPLAFDFPEKPPLPFDYTANISLHANMNPNFGSKIFKVAHGTRLEFVLQDTSFLHAENHPIHFHGHNFFIVGSGFGNFDTKRDPKRYNLVDPPERNTVAVPSGGWATIRFTADNPGAWFIHCHLEAHITWGLATAFIVEDGTEASQCLVPPPPDLPPC